ncbi:MAG: hydrogenase maturation protease [Acidobacteria bacterium]|nr:MAG: hydrogenase maturation protease [Acidobacteriota bacterium]
MREPVGRTLVIGLGNPLLSDDGVGWHVVRRLRTRGAAPAGVETCFSSRGGLALMERMVGYDQAVVVDATRCGVAPGTVRWFDPEMTGPRNASSSHDATLAAALELGRRTGAALPPPGRVRVLGIEVIDTVTIGEELSGPVRAAVDVAVRELEAALAGTEGESGRCR